MNPRGVRPGGRLPMAAAPWWPLSPCLLLCCCTLLLLLLLQDGVLLRVARVDALPMLLPNISSCAPQFSRKFGAFIDCCLDLPNNPPLKPFSQIVGGSSNNATARRQKLRVRQPAHLMDEEAAEKLNRAYALARALPPEDPRSFAFQSRLHCFYSYQRMRSQQHYPDAEYNIHLNWLFHPFHRLLTYFHERILASLLGDEDFALPFWNWDNQTPSPGPLPNAIPPAYLDPVKYPALYDVFRGHSGRQIVDLAKSSSFARPYDTDDELRVLNNDLLHRILVDKSEKDPVLFFSTPIHPGETGAKVTRLDNDLEELEAVVHGAVHAWTGQDDTGMDMGASWTAADDPLFYTHHANVDRLWNVWLGLGGNRHNIDDPDWLNSEFFFFDEHGDMVHARVRDALSTDVLGYTYADVDNPWISFQAPPQFASASPHFLSSKLEHPFYSE